MQIIEAYSNAHLAHARQLFVEYAQAIQVDLCFQDFERELAELPGAYGSPDGRLLLAIVDHEAAGCVGLRKWEGTVCEMKRLYVRPPFRGFGIGRALARAAIDAGKKLGYHTTRLDTLSSMPEALALYASLGFHRINPYYPNPITGAVFMELPLR